MKKNKYLHIAIIILGIIFISIPIFHNNLWFDESYTVGIVSKSFADIWTIGSNDVHPILYYWLLHIIYLIFGSNIYIYRFFSMIPIAILGILGYTHIRKDFGKKVGLIFSFLVLFLPISSVYSGEIRMYSWAMLFVSLMAIYAYRIYKGKQSLKKEKIKNWCLFATFSLASCYTHYYALAIAFIINVILFIYLLVSALKKHKKENEIIQSNLTTEKENSTNTKSTIYTADLKCFTVSAISQIVLYFPWFLAAVVVQLEGMSNGFWIPKPSPEVFLQIFTFQFSGDLENLYISKNVAIIFASIILLYFIYSIIKVIISKIKHKEQNLEDNKTDIEIEVKNKNNEANTVNENDVNEKEINEKTSNDLAGYWAIGIYFIVIICILIISIVKPLLYARYFLNMTGLLIFAMAYFIAKGGKKLLTIIVCAIILIMSMVVNYNLCEDNYNPVNSEPLNYVEQDLQEGDMILFDNRGSGFVISMQLIDVPNCFYDKERWNVEAAYEAFGTDMLTIKTLDELSDYEGRIWLVTSDDYTIYNEFLEMYGEKITLIKEKQFEIKYHGYKYAISLIEKDI